MYVFTVILLLLVLPLASIAASSIFAGHALTLDLIGKWVTFWAAGVRLFIAGLRQVIQPQFTAQEIFEIHDRCAFVIVRELGFANLSMGLLATCTIVHPGWTVPAALVGGLYYGLAGAGHIFQQHRNAKENTAMVSDLLISALLLLFVCKS